MLRPLLVLSVALAGSASADPADVSAWVTDRAREQQAWVADQGVTDSGTGLYRERGAQAPAIPDFVAPTSLAPLIRAVREGVVNISTSNTAESGATRSLGSGFIISPEGYVVTNNHVVERAAAIRVKLADGREFEAEPVGRDPSTDLALLRLRGVGQTSLPTTFLGDSDRLEVGDWVVAIGNPFGLDHSVAHGMISAKERVIGVGMFDDFIQTDALINPGNSGGPLFNMRGEVVGVNTAIVSQGQGIGFAVPINMVKDLLPNLRMNGRLARGWLGVNIHEAKGPNGGAVITDVFHGSPAAQARLRPGDRVLAVNGRSIESYLQLLRRIAILAPGSTVRLTIHRSAAPQEVQVTLVERPSPETLALLLGEGRLDRVGLVVRDVTPALGGRLGLAPHSGVLVAAVLPNSPADQAGFRAGDLVSEVNRRRVQDVKSFRAALEQAAPSSSVLLRFQRGESVRYLAIRPTG